MLLPFRLTLTFVLNKGYKDSCCNYREVQMKLYLGFCLQRFEASLWHWFTDFLTLPLPHFPLILSPFVFIPLLTPFKRSLALVFEFSMAKLFIWPCSTVLLSLVSQMKLLLWFQGSKGKMDIEFFPTTLMIACICVCVSPLTLSYTLRAILGYQRLQFCRDWWMTARCWSLCDDYLRLGLLALLAVEQKGLSSYGSS